MQQGGAEAVSAVGRRSERSFGQGRGINSAAKATEVDRRVGGERNVEAAAAVELAHDFEGPVAISPSGAGSQVGTVALPGVNVQYDTRDHGPDRNTRIQRRIVAHDFGFVHEPGSGTGDAGGHALGVETGLEGREVERQVARLQRSEIPARPLLAEVVAEARLPWIEPEAALVAYGAGELLRRRRRGRAEVGVIGPSGRPTAHRPPLPHVGDRLVGRVVQAALRIALRQAGQGAAAEVDGAAAGNLA
jgi:hypothetical protein